MRFVPETTFIVGSCSFRRLAAATACIFVSTTVFIYSGISFSSRTHPVSDPFYACVVDPNPNRVSVPHPPGPDVLDSESNLRQVDAENLTVELGNHTYTPNGLLVVNPDGPHPIYELIRHAEASWQSKLSRASKTLEAAITEYHRRYHRQPPLGFDIWWQYATDHDVPLPDEYDQIYRDLEPFWGINPVDLASNLSDLEKRKEYIILGKGESHDSVTVFNSTLSDQNQPLLAWNLKNLRAVLDDVLQDLPPFRAVFSPHDNPGMLSDHAIKSMVLEAAAQRTLIDVKDLPPVNESGWIRACAPSSPARLSPLNIDDPPPRPAQKTFIYDHRLSMDPCLHPYLLTQHGQFLQHNDGPTPETLLVPCFSSCSTTLHYDIRPAVANGWIDDLLPWDNPPWEERIDQRLLWRGRNTGMYYSSKARWRGGQRPRLVQWANEMVGWASVISPTSSESEKMGNPQELRKAYINPALLNIDFAGEPIACEPKVCETLANEFEWRKLQTIKEAGKYKYILDVDGNGWSSRFKRLITSSSLVFKSTVYPEWFTERIQPWVHYVPVQVDLSDLYDSLVFFRGGPNGEGAHEEMARKIADAGRHWSRSFWRKEDMTAYMYRLILEYARVMSADRESMTYHGPI